MPSSAPPVTASASAGMRSIRRLGRVPPAARQVARSPYDRCVGSMLASARAAAPEQRRVRAAGGEGRGRAAGPSAASRVGSGGRWRDARPAPAVRPEQAAAREHTVGGLDRARAHAQRRGERAYGRDRSRRREPAGADAGLDAPGNRACTCRRRFCIVLSLRTNCTSTREECKCPSLARPSHHRQAPRPARRLRPRRRARILDEGLVCHLGFVVDGQPFVLPTAYARIGDQLYVHGSPSNRMLRTGEERHRSLRHGDLARRRGPGALGLPPLDELPLGRAARDGDRGRRSDREAGGVSRARRARRARALLRASGRRPTTRSRARSCCVSDRRGSAKVRTRAADRRRGRLRVAAFGPASIPLALRTGAADPRPAARSRARDAALRRRLRARVTAMLRLYDYLPSGNGYKVRLLLHASSHIPFELVTLDITKGQTRTPEFLAKNRTAAFRSSRSSARSSWPSRTPSSSISARGRRSCPPTAGARRRCCNGCASSSTATSPTSRPSASGCTTPSSPPTRARRSSRSGRSATPRST